MDCLEARRRAATDESAALHVATCSMCHAVLAHPDVEAALRASALALVAPANLPDPWPRLQAQLAAERGPLAKLRALPRGWVAVCGLNLSLLVLLGVEMRARGPHWDLWPLWHQLATLIGGTTLLGGGLSLGLRAVFFAPRKIALWAVGFAAVAAGVVLALTPAPLGASSIASTLSKNRALSAQALDCLRFGFLCTLPLLGWLAVSHRWQPRRPARRFAIATTAALCGMLALEVHCPATSTVHRLVAHASLASVFGLAALATSLLDRILLHRA